MDSWVRFSPFMGRGPAPQARLFSPKVRLNEWWFSIFQMNYCQAFVILCGILGLQPIYILHREGKSYSLIYCTTYVECHSKISTGLYTMFTIEQHLGPLEQVPATSMWHFVEKSRHFSRRVARIPVGDRDRIARKYWTLSSGPDERRIDTLWHFLAKKLLRKSSNFPRRVAGISGSNDWTRLELLAEWEGRPMGEGMPVSLKKIIDWKDRDRANPILKCDTSARLSISSGCITSARF